MLAVSSSSFALKIGALLRVWAILFCFPGVHATQKLYVASFSLILSRRTLFMLCIWRWKSFSSFVA